PRSTARKTTGRAFARPVYDDLLGRSAAGAGCDDDGDGDGDGAGCDGGTGCCGVVLAAAAGRLTPNLFFRFISSSSIFRRMAVVISSDGTPRFSMTRRIALHLTTAAGSASPTPPARTPAPRARAASPPGS